MTIAATAARYLLVLILLAAGVSGFYFLHNPPPAPTPLANDFQHVFFASGWVLYVDVVYILVALALLFNRYVPLALVALAGIIFNMYVFHITMMPAGLPGPIFMTVLWYLVARPLRAEFAPLLSPRPMRSQGRQ